MCKTIFGVSCLSIFEEWTTLQYMIKVKVWPVFTSHVTIIGGVSFLYNADGMKSVLLRTSRNSKLSGPATCICFDKVFQL